MNGPRLVRAFAHRNFRLFILGQGVSLIGTWMQQVAVAWLVFLLTGSPAWLGVAAFAGQIPSLLVAPVAGVLVDRWNRHRLLLLTQTLAMLQAFLMAALALLQVIDVWQIVALNLLLGVVNSFDMTARQAFLTEMVARKEDLANAIALNSSLVNGTRLVGPALAGFVVAWAGPGVCFLVNGLSYLAVLVALLAMRVPPRRRDGPHVGLLRGLREGFAYAFGFGPIRALLLLLALVSLVGMSYSVLLPVFATAVLRGGAETLGILNAASGLGALAAAVALASRRSVVGLGRWVTVAPALFGAALIGFSFAAALWLAAPLLAVVGFAMMMQMAATNTILQTIVAEEWRGRVMSYYTVAFLGMAPLGSLLGGALADAVGAPLVVRLAGGGCIVASVVFALRLSHLRALVRPIYERLGILPEVATGLQRASELTVPPERP
jgi:MFS family permease